MAEDHTAKVATITTIGQPTPTRTRFAPVMLASASEQTSGVPPSAAYAPPHCTVKTKSTAYSGSTASRSARSASARPALMPTCTASAPQGCGRRCLTGPAPDEVLVVGRELVDHVLEGTRLDSDTHSAVAPRSGDPGTHRTPGPLGEPGVRASRVAGA